VPVSGGGRVDDVIGPDQIIGGQANPDRQERLASIRAGLGGARFAAARAEDQAMTLGQAIA